MMLAYAICLPAVLGYLVVNALLRGGSATLPEKLAFCYPLGIGLMTLLWFLLGLCGAPLTLAADSASALACIFLAALWNFRKVRSKAAGSVTSGGGSTAAGPLRMAAELFLGGWIIVKVCAVLLQTLTKPVVAFDSYVNWSARAKAFYYAGNLLLDPGRSDFLGRRVVLSTGNYPVLDPLAQVWLAQCLGNFDEVLVKIWTLLFCLSAAAYLYLVARRETDRLLALMVVVIFVSSPLVALHATENLADFPLAVYLLFALGALLSAARGESRYLPLIGLFSVLAMFTKVEALFFAAPLFLMGCIAAHGLARQSGMPVRGAFLRLCAPYLLIVPWFLFKQYYRLGSGTDECVFSFSFNPRVFIDFFTWIVTLQNFNVVFLFIPLALLACRRPDRELLFMIFPVFSYALSFLAIYAFIGYYNDGNMRYNSSMMRTALTYYPAACLIVSLLLKRLLCTEARSGADS